MKRIWMCGIAAAGFLWVLGSQPAEAQVWIDATQVGDQKPEWVEAKYFQPVAREPVRQTVWVAPVCRIVTQRVWHEAVYQTVCDRIWTEGHFGMRLITQYDPCGCPVVREERFWIPGHYTTVQRQVLVTPGYWEMVQVSEVVAPGCWRSLEGER